MIMKLKIILLFDQEQFFVLFFFLPPIFILLIHLSTFEVFLDNNSYEKKNLKIQE